MFLQSSCVYTAEEREGLRQSLLSAARADTRIGAAAIFGSGAVGKQDRWSDLDLAFGVEEPGLISAALQQWTTLMYQDHSAVHHVDVAADSWVYRVFLLRNTLQVDLAFAPLPNFGPRGPAFQLLFGETAQRIEHPPPTAAHLIGFGWLHALHARSAIERGRFWQAEYMISAVRDHALALACLRHDLPTDYAKGADRLPPAVTRRLTGALVGTLRPDALRRAFRPALTGLLREADHVDPDLGARLRGPLMELAGPHP